MSIRNSCKIKPFFWHLKGVLLALLLASCNASSDPKQEELPEVPFELIRFEALFFGNPSASLDSIKSEFPYFFPSQTPDSVWVEKRINPLQQELYQATKTLFEGTLSFRIEQVLRYIQYYFPEEKLPHKVTTLLSDVDYSFRAVDADSLLLISMDTYLGSDHPLYEGIPAYIRKKLIPEHLESELIDAFAHRFVPKPENRSFLAQLIAEGKRLVLQDYIAPQISGIHHIQYTQEQWDWAIAHEEDVWRYFVDQELLFSTDESLHFRFLSPSPYSKFYSYLDVDSPGRIGQWIGYRIVQAYRQRTNATLNELLVAPAQDILKKARYNP